MNATEDLRHLRQLHSRGRLTDKEFSAAKALLLNFGLSITEELQLFQQMHDEGALTEKELAVAQTMLLTLPNEKDTVRIVRSDRIDSSYEQRQLHKESILEQFDRGWEANSEGAVSSVNGKTSTVFGLFFLAGSPLFFYLAYLTYLNHGTDLPIAVVMGIVFLVFGFFGVFSGAKLTREYRASLALHNRLRAVLANRADVAMRIAR